MSARWHFTPGTGCRFSAESAYFPSRGRRSAPPMSPLIPVTSTERGAMARQRLYDRGVNEIADAIEPRRVPRVGHPAVGQIGERDARVRIGPAIRGADAAVTERARRRERAEPPDGVGRPAQVRAEAAVHRHAHVAVDPVARDVARDVGDGPRAPPSWPPASSI